jgi:lincosamide nucleotidyltransferase A/C/D/E
MVSAEEVIKIYSHLTEHGIRIWLTGGWGIDALLGEQTRPHKDLDVVMLLEDVVRMCALLECDGYGLKEVWSENRQAIDAQGVKTATAFVLADGQGCEIDIHALVLDEQGKGIPAWDNAEGFIFRKEGLEGKGIIAGYSVKCISHEMQVLCHTGYEVPEKQLQDLELLHTKFE